MWNLGLTSAGIDPALQDLPIKLWDLTLNAQRG